MALAPHGVGGRRDLLAQVAILCVLHNTYNLDGIAQGVAGADAEPPAHRPGAAEELSRHGLVDDGDRRRCRSVVAVEVAARYQRGTHGREIPLANGIEEYLRSLVRGTRATFDRQIVDASAQKHRSKVRETCRLHTRRCANTFENLPEQRVAPLWSVSAAAKIE